MIRRVRKISYFCLQLQPTKTMSFFEDKVQQLRAYIVKADDPYKLLFEDMYDSSEKNIIYVTSIVYEPEPEFEPEPDEPDPGKTGFVESNTLRGGVSGNADRWFIALFSFQR